MQLQRTGGQRTASRGQRQRVDSGSGNDRQHLRRAPCAHRSLCRSPEAEARQEGRKERGAMIEEATKKQQRSRLLARWLLLALAPASLDAARPSLEPASLQFSSVLSLTKHEQPSELAEDILNAIQAYSWYFCNLHKFQKGNASACYLAIQFERNPLFQDQFSLCFSGLMNSQPPRTP
eukprot:scaffold4273_cov215-Pinguiococcus_pyrenoidosus.AAC.7